MKLRIEVSTGRIFVCIVDSWVFWGDGIKGYNKKKECVVYVASKDLVALEVLESE